MRWLRFGALLMLLSITLAACAPGQVTAEEIMERMKAARENLNTAHVVADVTLTTPERNGAFTIEGWTEKTDQTDDAGRPIARQRAEVLAASGEERADELVGTLFVSDGATFWVYNPAENKVLTGELSELKQGDIGAQDPTAQMMRFQEMLQQLLDGSDVTIEDPSAEVAGRETWQVKLTPNQETQQQLQLGSIIDTSLWIDKQTDLPVKGRIDARDMGLVEATATTVEINQPIDASLFSFTPPAGAEVIDAAELAKQARPQVTTLADAQAQASFAVLSPATLPDGVQLDEVQVLRMRGETVVQNYSGAVNFSLVQSQGDLPGGNEAPLDATSEEIEVRGQTATLISSGAGAEQGTLLRWQENGVTIVIAGTLSADEATAIAESLN